MPNGNGYFDSQIGTWLPDDPKYVCDKCGEEFDNEDDLHEVNNDDYVCDSCFDDYGKCEHCHSLVELDEMEEVEDKIYCIDCYSDYMRNCEVCGGEYVEEDEDILLCKKCTKELEHLK